MFDDKFSQNGRVVGVSKLLVTPPPLINSFCNTWLYSGEVWRELYFAFLLWFLEQPPISYSSNLLSPLLLLKCMDSLCFRCGFFFSFFAAPGVLPWLLRFFMFNIGTSLSDSSSLWLFKRRSDFYSLIYYSGRTNRDSAMSHWSLSKSSYVSKVGIFTCPPLVSVSFDELLNDAFHCCREFSRNRYYSSSDLLLMLRVLSDKRLCTCLDGY